jgi:hypothetical protein
MNYGAKTGVYTFLHKTTSKDTFPIGPNEKIKSVSKNANFLIYNSNIQS